jgi:hypothetical protein
VKLKIEKLKREIYGPRAERTARLLDQLELELESSRAQPPRMSSPPRRPRPRRPMSLPSTVSVLRASRFPSICRGNA